MDDITDDHSAQQLRDAALVHHQASKVRHASRLLSGRPLDARAASNMRQVLDSSDQVQAMAGLARLESS